jgi:hypothetical protein
MKQRLCAVSSEALSKLPEHTDDKSGIGIHYADAFLKPMNATLADGTPVKAKRRGLKITVNVGTAKGDGLMRRLTVGPDPVALTEAAIKEACAAAGVEVSIENGEIWVTKP